MAAIILADHWVEEIARSQGIAWERCTRVIIDAKAGEPVRMYIEQLGDAEVLTIGRPEVLPPEIAVTKSDPSSAEAACAD